MLKKLGFLFESFKSNWQDYQRLKKLEQEYFNILAIKKDCDLIENNKWQKCQFYFKLVDDHMQVDDIRIDTVKKGKTSKKAIDENTKLLLHQSSILDNDKIFKIGKDSKFGDGSMSFGSDDRLTIG